MGARDLAAPGMTWQERQERIKKIRERLVVLQAKGGETLTKIQEFHDHAIRDLEFLLEELGRRPQRDRMPGLKTA